MKAATFAAHHIDGCKEPTPEPDQEPGDSGHDHPVLVEGILRFTVTPVDPPHPGTLQTPDDGVPGATTRRLRPAAPGSGAERRDLAPRLRTVLREIQEAGYQPDTIVECPMTGTRHRFDEYALELATARGATGWHLLYGQIRTSKIATWEPYSLQLTAVSAPGASRDRTLTVYVPARMINDVLRGATVDKLVDRWVLVLANLTDAEQSWVAVREPEHIALRR